MKILCSILFLLMLIGCTSNTSNQDLNKNKDTIKVTVTDMVSCQPIEPVNPDWKVVANIEAEGVYEGYTITFPDSTTKTVLLDENVPIIGSVDNGFEGYRNDTTYFYEVIGGSAHGPISLFVYKSGRAEYLQNIIARKYEDTSYIPVVLDTAIYSKFPGLGRSLKLNKQFLDTLSSDALLKHSNITRTEVKQLMKANLNHNELTVPQDLFKGYLKIDSLKHHGNYTEYLNTSSNGFRFSTANALGLVKINDSTKVLLWTMYDALTESSPFYRTHYTIASLIRNDSLKYTAKVAGMEEFGDSPAYSSCEITGVIDSNGIYVNYFSTEDSGQGEVDSNYLPSEKRLSFNLTLE